MNMDMVELKYGYGCWCHNHERSDTLNPEWNGRVCLYVASNPYNVACSRVNSLLTPIMLHRLPKWNKQVASQRKPSLWEWGVAAALESLNTLRKLGFAVLNVESLE